MAKDRKKREGQPDGAGGNGGGIVIPLIVAVMLGGLGGGAFGYFAMPNGSAPSGESEHATSAPPAPIPGRFPNDAIALSVPSIITDLDTEPKMRARLDVSIIVAHGTPESTTLVGEVREDVIAYLNGLTLAEIQGVRGFQNLREQLDDRARVRGRGAILGLLIGGLVLE